MEADVDILQIIEEAFKQGKEETLFKWLETFIISDRKRLKESLAEANATLTAIRKIVNGAKNSDEAIGGIKALLTE